MTESIKYFRGVQKNCIQGIIMWIIMVNRLFQQKYTWVCAMSKFESKLIVTSSKCNNYHNSNDSKYFDKINLKSFEKVEADIYCGIWNSRRSHRAFLCFYSAIFKRTCAKFQTLAPNSRTVWLATWNFGYSLRLMSCMFVPNFEAISLVTLISGVKNLPKTLA